MRYSVSRSDILTVLSTFALLAFSACNSQLPPLQGVAPSDNVLPLLQLSQGARQMAFTWELQRQSIVARGNGVARMVAPDSARVDLFLAGGFGAGAAILIGDTLHFPPGGGSQAEGLVPPPRLLWAALGRLSLPATRDTVIRVLNDTLRADLGRPVQWRVTAVHGRLTSLDRIAEGHIVESVRRSADGVVSYESSNHLSLVLHIQRDQPVAAFDASIWHF